MDATKTNSPEATTEAPKLATFGQRFLALLGDWLLCLLLANGAIAVLHLPGPPAVWPSVVLVIEYTVFLTFFTQTPGMRILRIHCLKAADAQPLGFLFAGCRAVLLALVVPILTAFSDPHRRGLHDKLTGSAVVR